VPAAPRTTLGDYSRPGWPRLPGPGWPGLPGPGWPGLPGRVGRWRGPGSGPPLAGPGGWPAAVRPRTGRTWAAGGRPSPLGLVFPPEC